MDLLWIAITGISLAFAGFFGVVCLSLIKIVAVQGGRLRREGKERKEILENVKQTARITSAYDAAIAIRKYIEDEERKFPTLYVETDDPDQPYAPYDLDLTRRWMKPIRVLLENELAFTRIEEDDQAKKGKKPKISEDDQSKKGEDQETPEADETTEQPSEE